MTNIVATSLTPKTSFTTPVARTTSYTLAETIDTAGHLDAEKVLLNILPELGASDVAVAEGTTGDILLSHNAQPQTQAPCRPRNSHTFSLIFLQRSNLSCSLERSNVLVTTELSELCLILVLRFWP